MKFQSPGTRRTPVAFSIAGGVVASAVLFSACSPVKPVAQVPVSGKTTTSPQFIADPFEPVNRGIWAVNKGILVGVLQPSGRVYRAVVPPPVRQSVNHFAHNLTYPGRVVNNMLQGRWQGAGDESLRFLCNTTVGVGGLFDVATKWDIPRSEANFGQTFYRWGWKPSTFVMLPFLGPSDNSHAPGTVLDKAVEPMNLVSPPYSYASAATAFNRLSDQTEGTVQFIRTEADPYVGVKDIWTYVSKEEPPDWQTTGPKDPGTLQTLGVALLRPSDPKFIERGRELSVVIPTTGRKMKCNVWMQETTAPVVYISPGLGSHRISNMTLSLAEYVYQNGFSVVTTTGVFHPDFMENASTAALPAYPPVDCKDLLVEYTEIDRALGRKHPGMIGKRALVGFSMGGFQALYLAARENKADAGLLRFDRYVAINTPVDLHFGVKTVDSYYNTPESWPSGERQAKLDNSLHKVAKLPTLPPASLANPPFDAIESKYLIGLSFRLTLRDIIFSSQSRNNMGVLQTPISQWRRDPCYDEIGQLSFRDYFLGFVVPHYGRQGVGLDDFAREINLRSYQKSLRADSRIRVIVNSNDFLLNSSDLSWLKGTFGPRLTVFPQGGHLGNLTSPPVRNAVAKALDGLK